MHGMEVVDSSMSNHQVEVGHRLVVELTFFLSEILVRHSSSTEEEEEVEYSSPLHCEVTTLSVKTMIFSLEVKSLSYRSLSSGLE